MNPSAITKHKERMPDKTTLPLPFSLIKHQRADSGILPSTPESNLSGSLCHDRTNSYSVTALLVDWRRLPLLHFPVRLERGHTSSTFHCLPVLQHPRDNIWCDGNYCFVHFSTLRLRDSSFIYIFCLFLFRFALVFCLFLYGGARCVLCMYKAAGVFFCSWRETGLPLSKYLCFI